MFKTNPYFEDTKLTKTFTFLEEGMTKITATNIKWKEGMVRFPSLSGGVLRALGFCIYFDNCSAFLDFAGHS